MIWPDLNKQIPACWPGHPSIIQITHHLHQFLDFTKNIQTLFHFVASLAYELNYTVGTLISHRKIAPLSACLLDKQRSPCIKSLNTIQKGTVTFSSIFTEKCVIFTWKAARSNGSSAKPRHTDIIFFSPCLFLVHLLSQIKILQKYVELKLQLC